MAIKKTISMSHVVDRMSCGTLAMTDSKHDEIDQEYAR
jgi:hypothetical protein